MEERIPKNHGDEEILSDDELNALLDHSEASTEGIGSERNVLVVSRRNPDLELLTRILAERGVGISIARNPFTALDYLRIRDFCGVISDFALWASSGSMLFERIRKLDRPVEVVFICDRGNGEADMARRSGALAVLERPLDAREVSGAVNELCRGSSLPAGAVAAGDSGKKDNEGREPEPSPAGAPGPTPSRETRGTGEGWYRFFFEARRALRTPDDAAAHWNRVLDLFLEAQGGGATAILETTAGATAVGDPTRPDSRFISLRLAVHPGNSRATPESLELRLFQALAGLRPDDPGTTAPAGALVLPWKGAGDRPRFLISIAAAGTVTFSPDILDELPHLLREIDGAVP